MKEKIIVKADGFRSVEEFVEFSYVHGSHDLAARISEAYGINEFYFNQIKDRYRFIGKHSKECKELTIEALKLLAQSAKLCSVVSYVDLACIAASLPKNSNILEIGTWKGASTISLSIGAQKSRRC